MLKKGFIYLLFFIVIIEVSNTVFAANEEFSMSMGNTGTTFNILTSYNGAKQYEEDPATLKVTYNNAPGWGFLVCLKHRYYSNGMYMWATDTEPQWVSGLGVYYLSYYSGCNVIGRNYYFAARIDDDYTGFYTLSGMISPDQIIW